MAENYVMKSLNEHVQTDRQLNIKSASSIALKFDQLNEQPNALINFNTGILQWLGHQTGVLSSSTVIGTADTLVLYTENRSSELYLTNRTALRKKIQWTHGQINDITWSSILSKFILLADYYVFTFDAEENKIEEIKQISVNRGKIPLYSCTCSKETILLSYFGWGSIVDQYKLSNGNWERVKQWKTPFTCNTNEWIGQIRFASSNDGHIGLTIADNNNNWRFELREYRTMEILHQVRLDESSLTRCLVCLPHDEWLIVHKGTKTLEIIDKVGSTKKTVTYNSNITSAGLFDQNCLVISTYEKICFYNL
ncbi:unnamed protein product [Didymodactylos carnosus]|uniref:Uncharacterized protein n=1 Tax=Didymodactylos carnosus TaxID=1234261 RepID=A0A813YBZ7_9BILA|nr:unnamed protein product [Didymodactylos carnosus]CAF3668063.1 unnamed protein product [Didymodactylos carnosus]